MASEPDGLGGRILELGSGEGAFSRLLRQVMKDGATLVGIDREPRENACLDSSVEGLVENLPFSSGSFDVVACRFVLVYVSSLEKAIQEIARVTVGGGVFLSHELLIDHLRPGSTVYPKHSSFLALVELMRSIWSATALEEVPLRLPGLLREHGFDDINVLPQPAAMVQHGPSWLASRLAQLRDVRDFAITEGIATTCDLDALAEDLTRDYEHDVDVVGLGITTLGISARRIGAQHIMGS